MKQPARSTYPPISDYALISDCHCAALVSRAGSIDWCCMPRMDSAPCFGRLLDWSRGGYFSIAPHGGGRPARRRYFENTLVLESTFASSAGEAVVHDFFTMSRGGRERPARQLVRIVEGIRGQVDFRIQIVPRFDYGEVKPWLRRIDDQDYAAVGGANGLVIWTQEPLTEVDKHDLNGSVTVRAGERVRFSLWFLPAHELEGSLPSTGPEELDKRLRDTQAWWRRWSDQAEVGGPDAEAVVRSAIVLKALTHAPTGAIAAAPTTSLPERLGGERNWDYRFSWIRDSSFSVRSLNDAGFTKEADGFRRFMQRSAAGSAHELQIVYGLGGERRLTEVVLPGLEGYAGSRPVRIGNAASEQIQLDAYGELMELSWRWQLRGHSPDDDYWRFLLDIVAVVEERWQEPDRGMWEIRGEPQHFVHSKVMCWVAVERGIRLAQACLRRAPLRRWQKLCLAIREAIDDQGYDRDRGVFMQAFGNRSLDAALLLLPSVDFVAYDDERMIRTVDAIREGLVEDGLVQRYQTRSLDDGVGGREGAFIACTFWLVECLAHQGRHDEACEAFDRAAATANDLGLFAEEYDAEKRLMLGNFPQGLTHLSHISAALALGRPQRTSKP